MIIDIDRIRQDTAAKPLKWKASVPHQYLSRESHRITNKVLSQYFLKYSLSDFSVNIQLSLIMEEKMLPNLLLKIKRVKINRAN